MSNEREKERHEMDASQQISKPLPDASCQPQRSIPLLIPLSWTLLNTRLILLAACQIRQEAKPPAAQPLNPMRRRV